MKANALRWAAAAGVVIALATPAAAQADSCEDECGTPCTASSRCPDTGVECYVDDDADALKKCRDDAIAKGYELRCERNYEVYCDPAEADPEAGADGDGDDDGSGDEGSGSTDDEGCAVRSPRSAPRGLGAALVTFAAAAAVTGFRVLRRRGR